MASPFSLYQRDQLQTRPFRTILLGENVVVIDLFYFDDFRAQETGLDRDTGFHGTP